MVACRARSEEKAPATFQVLFFFSAFGQHGGEINSSYRTGESNVNLRILRKKRREEVAQLEALNELLNGIGGVAVGSSRLGVDG